MADRPGNAPGLPPHKDDLAHLGDGDPYVGLERAGMAEWIEAGKDPEAEWRRKYSPAAETKPE